MNKLRTWWYVFKNSITNFSYYRDVLKAPITFSLKYLFVLVYAVIFLQAVVFSIQAALLLPQLPQALQTIETRLMNIYPEDLIITINNGVLSTNKEEPIFIDIPELEPSEAFDHLITIDTEASAEAFLDYETFFLITDKEVIYPESTTDDAQTYQIITLESIEDNIRINKQNYLEHVTKITSMFPLLPRIAPFLLTLGTVLIPLLLALFVTASHLLLLLFLSVVTWTLAAVFKLKMSYMKAFQLGMHGLTFPILIQMLITLSGNSFPMAFISGFIFWMVLVLSQMQEVKAE